MTSLPGGRHLRQRVRVQPHARPREAVRYDLADRRSEDGEGTRLGGHERQLEIADVHALGALRCHERQLVQRERPHRADRLDEGEVAGVAALDVLDDPVVGRVGVGVSEGRDVLVGLDLARADGDQQGVILDAAAVLRVDRAGVGVDPLERVLRPVGARVVRDSAQRVPARPPEGERLADGHRAVDELVARRQKLDVDGVAGEPSEAKKTLDCRDAAATDHDTEISHCRTVRASAPLAIGALPDRFGGELRSRCAGTTRCGSCPRTRG